MNLKCRHVSLFAVKNTINTFIYLLLLAIALSSCAAVKPEISKADFIDRLVDLAQRDKLLDPIDVGNVIGVKLERDQSIPFSQPSSVLYLPPLQSPLREAETRYNLTLDPRIPIAWQGSTLDFNKVHKLICIDADLLVVYLDKRFERGLGSNPEQLAWILSDKSDHRTFILIPRINEQSGCLSSIVVSTKIKQL